MIKALHSIKHLAEEEINKANSLQSIQELKVKYLGKKGLITEKVKSLRTIPDNERPEYGRTLNEIKVSIENLLGTHEDRLKAVEIKRVLNTQGIDITIPGSRIPTG